MNKKSGFYKNGKSHAEGGIPVLVDGNTPIEVEKFEYVICNNAMNSTKIFEFKDKTNKEILDEIFRYSDCEFEQHKANSGDFIICKLAVMDKKKRNITGTAKEIINVMQSENSCNVTNDRKEFKDGGEIENDETYTKWKNLVNMSKSELEKFYESKEGKEAGLSSSEASKQGISSGRESARWIMKMKDTPKSEWTPTMWKWAKKQISFISRMSGMKGDLYDDNGNKTRKHTSLLIWGHNPKKYKNGGELSINNEITVFDETKYDDNGKDCYWKTYRYNDSSISIDYCLGDFFKIDSIGTKEKSRRGGDASKLIDYAKEIALKNNFDKIDVYLPIDENTPRPEYTLEDYKKAVSFYKKNGFEFYTNSTVKMFFDLNKILKNGGELNTNETKPIRFEAGKKLTETEKKDIYKNLNDSYKVKHRPFTEENDRIVWLDNASDYMTKSDITGRLLRWYIYLPDGRIAHPTEVFGASVTMSEIDRVQKNIEQNEFWAKKEYDQVFNSLKKQNEIKKVVDAIDTAITNGAKFKEEYDSNDLGKRNKRVRLLFSNGNNVSIPEYVINTRDLYLGLDKSDLVKHRLGEVRNKYLNFQLSEIDWEKFYNENKTNEMENKENKIGNIFEFNSKVFDLILKPISEKYKFNIIKKEGKSNKEPYYELVSNNNSEIKRSGFINSYFQKNKNIDTYSITGNLFIEFIDNNDLHERIPIYYEFIDNNVDFNNAYSEIDKQFNEYKQTYLSLKENIKVESEHKETLQGGKADKLTIEDIAKKHNVSVEYAKEQLNKGMNIELEHTNNTEKQKEIALDHLSEFIEYYNELDKMEEKLKIMENKEINTPNVTNWNEVPKVWKNTKEIKKVNFINSPYNKDLIKLLTPFAGDDNLRPIMSGIHFDENGITVTDAHKLINLPYPNKDFNGTYATIPKKFLKDEKSIKNDLFSGNYPNYKVVIPTSDKAERVQEISVYKLLQYTEVALHYASISKQVAFSLGDIRYGLNGEFLIEVLELALKLGHKKLYAFTTLANKAIVFSDNKNYELGKDLIILQMPVMLLNDYDHKGKKYERPLGAHDLDWDRAITVYYDFSKDAIVNEDGSIAEFKMNYGEYDVINPNEINILKNFEGKNNVLPILDYFKVQGNKIIASNLETFITIKKVNLKDGLYQIRDNAVEFDPTFTLSSYEEYPNPRDKSEKKLEFSINSDVLLHYVKIALDYVGHDDLRPVMSGMLFDYVDGKLFIVATDAHKLLKINITRFVNIEKQDNFQFILSTINLLKVLDNINESVLTIKATKELAIIESDEFEFESRLIDGKYPAYNQVISAFKNKKLTINIKDLFTCIKSKEAESFVKSNKGEDILIYDKLKNESELNINLGFLESGYSKDIKIAESVEICKVDYKLENGDYQTKDNLVLLMPIFGNNEGEHFMFNYKFFKTVLETLNCEDVELFYDEKNRAYIFGGDCFGYESTIKAKKKEVTKKSIIDVENETANVINEIFNEWEKIKNESQHEKWSNKVNSLRFGTYKNQNILDVIEKFSPKYPNEVIKKDFIKELYKSLKIELPENLKFKTEIKEQSNEQKELKEAINTFEELIKLGGTDAEMKEWQEAIDTFKMLLDDEPTKYAKGGNVEKQHSDLEKEIMESQFGNLD